MNTKKYAAFFLLFGCVMIAMTDPAISEQQILVICNKTVPRDSLSPEDIKQIFLGRKAHWADNQKISFVIMKHGDIHAKFIRSCVSRTPSQYKVFWKRMIFTGRGSSAPLYLKTPEEVLTYVSGTPGAIGYVPDNLPRDQVKVVATIPAN